MEKRNRKVYSKDYKINAVISYRLNEQQKVIFSSTYDYTKRIGFDSFEGDRSAGFRSPQNIAKFINAISYEINAFDNHISSTMWLKNYNFKANSVDQVYIIDSKGYRPVEVPVSGHTNDFGYGFSSKYEFLQKHILKFSFENAYRIPDAEEILGDGLLIKNNPRLVPEQSYNLNFSYLITDVKLSEELMLTFEQSLFFRDVNNLIIFTVQENRGVGLNENIGEVIARGFSTELAFSYKNALI